MLINGTEMNVEEQTITNLLIYLEIPNQNLVVEINGGILSKDYYDEHVLKKDDKIEIVSFVGGG